MEGAKINACSGCKIGTCHSKTKSYSLEQNSLKSCREVQQGMGKENSLLPVEQAGEVVVVNIHCQRRQHFLQDTGGNLHSHTEAQVSNLHEFTPFFLTGERHGCNGSQSVTHTQV